MDHQFIEDNFDLEEYQRSFAIDTKQLNQSKNTFFNEEILLRVLSLIIMITALTVGSFLYKFLSGLIEKVHL